MSDFGAVWNPAALGNYDTSRLKVNLIIAHHTACPLSAALGRFQQPGTQVSAHFIVAQDGTVYETVPIGDTAYHSGDYTINERSIGIEHESGPVGQDFFTDAQYAASTQLMMHLAEHFGFPLDRAHLWPHQQVVATACPGKLDLNRLLSGVGAPTTDPGEVVPATTVQSIVYDITNPDGSGNDRSFVNYADATYILGDIAPCPDNGRGGSYAWDRAKFVADPKDGVKKWLDRIAGTNKALWDGCLDDGGFDPPHFAAPPTPPVVTPPVTPPVVTPPVVVPVVTPPVVKPPDPPLPSEAWLRALLRLIFKILGASV